MSWQFVIEIKRDYKRKVSVQRGVSWTGKNKRINREILFLVYYLFWITEDG